MSGHIAPWKVALVLAILGFASYVLIGMPMGITTSYAKIGAMIESLFVPEHVKGVAYYSSMPLNYVPPLADTAISGRPGPQFDAVAAIQFPLILGIVGGAFFSAVRLREFHMKWRLPARQFVSALTGGVLLGLAARMSPSCNVWHLWGGVPLLAMTSLLFVLGLIPGAWLGSRLLTRFVVR